jgi:hypothetical protein
MAVALRISVNDGRMGIGADDHDGLFSRFVCMIPHPTSLAIADFDHLSVGLIAPDGVWTGGQDFCQGSLLATDLTQISMGTRPPVLIIPSSLPWL